MADTGRSCIQQLLSSGQTGLKNRRHLKKYPVGGELLNPLTGYFLLVPWASFKSPELYHSGRL